MFVLVHYIFRVGYFIQNSLLWRAASKTLAHSIASLAIVFIVLFGVIIAGSMQLVPAWFTLVVWIFGSALIPVIGKTIARHLGG